MMRSVVFLRGIINAHSFHFLLIRYTHIWVGMGLAVRIAK